MGANSALIVTVPDLARYAKSKKAQVYGQALGLPLSQTICAAFGIITTVSFSVYYLAYFGFVFFLFFPVSSHRFGVWWVLTDLS
jgi:cytosine/uracil/thiamine/allantoin permease